jgi:hypothetical protein
VSVPADTPASFLLSAISSPAVDPLPRTAPEPRSTGRLGRVEHPRQLVGGEVARVAALDAGPLDGGRHVARLSPSGTAPSRAVRRTVYEDRMVLGESPLSRISRFSRFTSEGRSLSSETFQSL